MALDKFLAVLTTGAFFDTDDAMRAVQVRDLLAGQNWFDMTQYRLDPPAGVFMHWSRVVDAPLALLVKTFGLIAEPALSERLARLVFPFLLTIGFFAVTIALCERLLGSGVRYFALAAAFLYGPATGQFEPGRIDHHAPQILLLMIVVWGFADAFIVRRLRMATLAGAAFATSMAVSVENVPFFAAVIGGLVVLWIFSGGATAPVLRAFAFGLAVFSLLVFVATVAPSRWSIVADDALSLSQLTALLSASAALALLAVSPLQARMSRLALASLVGLLIGTGLLVAFPGLFERPFTHLDPLLKSLWLDHVEEAQPLLRKWRDDPGFAIGITVPALIGVAASTWFAAQCDDGARHHVWFIVACTALGGLAASILMVRTMSAVQALAIPGSLGLVLALRSRLSRQHVMLAGPAATFAMIVASSSVGWAAGAIRLSPALRERGATPSALTGTHASNSRCATPASFSQLAALPNGKVLADPDLGGYILAHTPHTVVSAAYHRNVSGMRTALSIFTDRELNFAAALDRTGARYLVICPEAFDGVDHERSRQGVIAQLLRGETSATLRHLAAHDSALRIYLLK